MIRVSHETFRALASSGVRVTSCVESTVFAATSVNTPSIFARFRPARAGVASRAENRLAIATRERVAHHAFQTNTRRTLGTDDALCVVAANHSFTLTYAFSSRLVLFPSIFAAAPSSVSFGDANSIFSAWQRTARVHANGVLASQLTGAIVILITFGTS